MVEYLVKRALVITLLAFSISYGLTPLENRLKNRSDAIFMHGMLENRVFFTVNDIYAVLDDLDLDHIWHYFIYQFVRYPSEIVFFFYIVDVFRYFYYLIVASLSCRPMR